MPCKLCDKSIQQSKADEMGCTHSSFPFTFKGTVALETDPARFGLHSGLPINQFLQFPQLNMMLTASLLKGERIALIIRLQPIV